MTASKRILAAALVLVLSLGLLPAAALAADGAGVTAQYTTWKNAAVAVPGEAVLFTPEKYTSGFTADQLWIAVNTTGDDQAISMEFVNIKKTLNVYIYSGATLKGASPSDKNCLDSLGVSSSRTVSWKAGAAGPYYLMLRPSGSSNVSSTQAAVTFSLVEPDAMENNDTWQNASELTENVSAYFNINGWNDEDWFRITSAVPGEAIKLSFSNFDYTVGSIRADLFTEDTLEASSDDAVWSLTNFSVNSTTSYKADEPGVFYLRVRRQSTADHLGFAKSLRLSYTMVPPDANELNDSWESATHVPYGSGVGFTLNGQNDEDWFRFDTVKPNEAVNLRITGFETDYSNNITLTVYDALRDAVSGDVIGYDGDSLYYSSGINITCTRAMTFSEPGAHFISVRRTNGLAVENTLTLLLEQGVSDALEPNDTWGEAVQLTEGIPTAFNLSANDTDFFRLSATEPDQTLVITLKTPSGGSVNTALFSGADFEEYGDGANSLAYWGVGRSGTVTYRYMLDGAGDYYLRLTPYRIFEEDATVSYALIPPDANEPNGEPGQDVALTEGVALSFTLPATNDTDWFKFTVPDPDCTVEVRLSVPIGGSVSTALYSGADFEEYGISADHLAYWGVGPEGSSFYRYMLGAPGDYYLRLTPYRIFDGDATVSYALIYPDANEPNGDDGQDTALTEGVALSFTFPASNDTDWFKFSVTEPDRTLHLAFTVPAGGSVSTALYSGADFEEYGDGADSLAYWGAGPEGSSEYVYMLGEPGEYYLRLTPFRRFDQEATVTYTLTPPDANENNNSCENATQLESAGGKNFTLPASNDADWFVITVPEGDRTLELHLNVPSGGGVSAAVYSGADIEDYGDNADSIRYFGALGAGSHVLQCPLAEAGTCYVRLTPYHVFDSPATVWYSIVREGVKVTGIDSITNGGVTIFAGSTVQLYANVAPSDAADQSVKWSSGSTAVATIDENGTVTGVAPGSAVITAVTNDGGYRATCTITVAEPVRVTSVKVTANHPEKKGETQKNPYPLALKTGVKLTAGVLPENATEQGLVWSVSDSSVLSVTQYGSVYAVGSGSASVIVKTVDGGKTARFYINVPDDSQPVRSVSMETAAATIYMGEGGIDLKAAALPDIATNPMLIWSSSDTSVATVDQNGHVTPVSKGYAVITAAAAENADVKGQCSVSVQPKRTRVTGISFENDTMELGLYGSLTLQPKVTPAKATDKTVTWTTSNKNVATVSRGGVVTGINIGTAVITAVTSDGAFKASVTVKVSSAAPAGDINNDGSVDAGDALLVLRYSVGLIALSQAQQSVADVNSDGDIDAGDAILILRYDAGLIDAFPGRK